MIGIYKITSPSKCIYIGQSKNIERRFNEYKINQCKTQKRLYNSLLKHGWQNHKFEIIHELPIDVTQDVLDRYEIFVWKQYKEAGFEMLNIQEPGNGGKHSDNTKSLISLKNKEYEITQFDKSGKFIKHWTSVYEAGKILNILSGCIYANLSNRTKTSGGFIFKKGILKENINPPLPRKKCINRRKRKKSRLYCPVFQYSLDGTFIKEWRSMTVAAEELKLNQRCISAVCNNITKQTGGFKWSKTKN